MKKELYHRQPLNKVDQLYDLVSSSAEITTDRRTNPNLRNQQLRTGDFALYSVVGNEVYVYMSKNFDPILVAYNESIKNQPVSKLQIRQDLIEFVNEKADYMTLNRDSTLSKKVFLSMNSNKFCLLKLKDLPLVPFNNKYSILDVNTKHYEAFKDGAKSLIEFAFGQGEALEKNMQMFQESGIKSVPIYLLRREEVHEMAGKNKMLLRACWLSDVNKRSRSAFGAIDDNFDSPLSMYGVVKGELDNVAQKLIKDMYFGIETLSRAITESNGSKKEGFFRKATKLSEKLNDEILTTDVLKLLINKLNIDF
jgi:hypothetical protein